MVVVTGGARGIGRAVCRNLAAGGGYAPAILDCDRSVEGVAEEVRAMGCVAMAIRADVSREEEVLRAAGDVRRLGEVGVPSYRGGFL